MQGPTCVSHPETYITSTWFIGLLKVQNTHRSANWLLFIINFPSCRLEWLHQLFFTITIFTIISLYSFSLCEVLMFLSNPFLPTAPLRFISQSLPFISHAKFLLTWWLLSNPFVLTLDFELCHKCFIDPFSLL